MTTPIQLTTEGAAARQTLADLPDWPLAGAAEAPRGAYLHVPFCFHKCHYCDFYSIVDARDRRSVFTTRLIEELAFVHGAGHVSAPLEAVFVGGGTPTLLEPADWTRLLAAMAEYLPGFPGIECTVEANPETVTPELLKILAGGGVNRLSIGAQSFDPRHLKTLERHHDPATVGRAIAMARDAGIERVSLDLIFGVPGQTPADWRADVDQALALEPVHLSAYGLMYESGTALTRRRDLGRIEPIDPDLEAEMYEHTIDRLGAAGFEQYEISNWALPGEACRHNLLYWRGRSWWAYGPSAVGFLADGQAPGGWRWRNLPRLGDYLATGPLPPVVDAERIRPATARGEAFMLELRLTEGMTNARLDALLAGDPDAERRRAVIDEAVGAGQLERRDGSLRFTAAGRMVADAVLAELI
ncbi:MAG: radical SAM family heme chaperone HemW [Phycisphaerales bacterium]